MTTGSQQNQALIPKLYAAYKEAGDWIAAHPEEAAALIAPKSTPADREALVSLIKANDRLGMNVSAGGRRRKADRRRLQGRQSIVGYFKTAAVEQAPFYTKPMK